MGYAVNPRVRVFLGYDVTATQIVPVDRRVIFEQRFWQQLSLNLWNRGVQSIDLRSRLEERDSFNFRGAAYRLRELISWNFTLFVHDKVVPVIYDEVFLNLNHPVWVSDRSVSQNRVFIGIIIPWKRNLMIRVGYLNQSLFVGRGVEMNHILEVSLLLNHDLT